MLRLEFVPIDLRLHEDLCVQFAEDAHIVSFGNADRFHEADGKGGERYRCWIRERLNADPKAAGWKDLGPRPGHPEVHYMEKDFTRSRGP